MASSSSPRSGKTITGDWFDCSSMPKVAPLTAHETVAAAVKAPLLSLDYNCQYSIILYCFIIFG